ncbi:unnamed protein product [Blepharisma stoltei]|uniref:Uncharacterized protein n=1 Tax=Blepharisma stoltei TaxID=1481888 RepID=A0AAU9JWV9_9CILI|nr:unnamed protein product [Blepharisma stoltei]
MNSWGGTSGVAASLTFYFKWATSIEFDTFNYVYLGSTINDYINTATSLKSSTAGDRVLKAASPPTSPILSRRNKISVSFSASSSSPSVAYGSYYILRISDSGLPFIASNKATFYEIWVIATYEGTTEIGSSVISVLPQKTSSKLYALLACNDQLDGIPIVVYFEPINTSFDFSSHAYAIDIEIGNGYDWYKGFMGTGIKITDNGGALTINSHFLSSSSSDTASYAFKLNYWEFFCWAWGPLYLY